MLSHLARTRSSFSVAKICNPSIIHSFRTNNINTRSYAFKAESLISLPFSSLLLPNLSQLFAKENSEEQKDESINKHQPPKGYIVLLFTYL